MCAPHRDNKTDCYVKEQNRASVLAELQWNSRELIRSTVQETHSFVKSFVSDPVFSSVQSFSVLYRVGTFTTTEELL